MSGEVLDDIVKKRMSELNDETNAIHAHRDDLLQELDSAYKSKLKNLESWKESKAAQIEEEFQEQLKANETEKSEVDEAVKTIMNLP